MRVLIREQLVKAELAAAKLNIHEIGGDNHGPWVKKFLAEVGLPEGYAWCDAFQSYEEHGVAGHQLPIESASVAQTYETAKKIGWLVATPGRGDLGCVNWTHAGPPFADHILLVVNAVSLGAYWKLRTVEGNTSSGAAGSQSNGDGVYLRTRIISKTQIAFVRIPGYTSAAAHGHAHQHPAAHGHAPATIRRGATGPPVGRLQTLLNRNGFHLKNDHVFGDETEHAVTTFQHRHHLPGTGIVNAATWHALEEKAKP
jgi:hypothetical protein